MPCRCFPVLGIAVGMYLDPLASLTLVNRLAKTQGVNKLVVAINKMDDPTVEWSEDRYKECSTKLATFLKGAGYNLKTDVFFMPIAAQQLIGIKDRVPKDVCPWYDGPSLLEYLDNMQALERKVNAPFMMAVAGKYRDMGTVIEGKIEAGVTKKGMSLIMMPNRHNVDIAAVYGETEEEVAFAQCGEQVRLRLRGIEEDDVLPGVSHGSTWPGDGVRCTLTMDCSRPQSSFFAARSVSCTACGSLRPRSVSWSSRRSSRRASTASCTCTRPSRR